MSGGPSVRAASFRAAGADALEALGRAMGEALAGALGCRPTLLLGFDGELGTGKTTLIGGALRALGVRSAVTSPTYGLVHPYAVAPRGSGNTFQALHIDLYRLRHASELEELGLREDLPGLPADSGKVLLVEWFANAGGRLGRPDVAVSLRHSDRGRIVRAQGHSPPGGTVVQGMRAASHPRLVSPVKEVSC